MAKAKLPENFMIVVQNSEVDLELAISSWLSKKSNIHHRNIKP